MGCRVVIAEDHHLIVAGYRLLLEKLPDIEIIGVVHDGKGAIRMIEDLQPDLLLLDIMLQGLNGIKVMEYLRQHHIETKILVVSMVNDLMTYKKIMKLGARGFLLKHAEEDEILMAVKKVLAGKSYYSSDIFRKNLSQLEEPLEHYRLPQNITPREKEVLTYIAKGMTNKEMAESLFLSPKTIETHRTNLMKKINARNTAGLVRYAVVHGLV